MSKKKELRGEFIKEFVTPSLNTNANEVTILSKFADWWLSKYEAELKEIQESISKIDDTGGGNGRRIKVLMLAMIDEKLKQC